MLRNSDIQITDLELVNGRCKISKSHLMSNFITYLKKSCDLPWSSPEISRILNTLQTQMVEESLCESEVVGIQAIHSCFANCRAHGMQGIDLSDESELKAIKDFRTATAKALKGSSEAFQRNWQVDHPRVLTQS